MMSHLIRVLLILSLLLVSVQTASAQEPDSLLSPDITCSDLDGAYALSQEPSPVYLGFFGSQYALDSIMNPYGPHGSQFSSLSVRNQFGRYGSSTSSYSANNQFASTPPVILKNGFVIAYLTTNTLISGGISLATIDASCTFYATAPSTGTLPPAAPTSVSASDGLYTDAIVVMWNPVSGADHYVVFGAESLNGELQFIGVTSDTMMSVTGPVPGTTHWFWVAAGNNSGLSNLSEPDSGYIALLNSSFVLSVQKSGTGSGKVTSAPTGIDCGSDCSMEYAEGTVVTLTAASDSGSTFAGWTGACTGTTTCTVTMDSDKSVTAQFEIEEGEEDQHFVLSVHRSGDGSGRVLSSPVGIDCGAVCSAEYAEGTVVTLTVTSDTGSTFGGWSGACTGTADCTMTMDGDKTVTAAVNKDDDLPGHNEPPVDESSTIYLPMVIR